MTIPATAAERFNSDIRNLPVGPGRGAGHGHWSVTVPDKFPRILAPFHAAPPVNGSTYRPAPPSSREIQAQGRRTSRYAMATTS
ncbi:hypothetical protein GCM10022629_30400 [Amorphoplanes auranticolor]